MKGVGKALGRLMSKKKNKSKDGGIVLGGGNDANIDIDQDIDDTDVADGAAGLPTSINDATSAPAEIFERMRVIDDYKSVFGKMNSCKTMIRDLVDEKWSLKRKITIEEERTNQRDHQIHELEKEMAASYRKRNSIVSLQNTLEASGSLPSSPISNKSKQQSSPDVGKDSDDEEAFSPNVDELYDEIEELRIERDQAVKALQEHMNNNNTSSSPSSPSLPNNASLQLKMRGEKEHIEHLLTSANTQLQNVEKENKILKSEHNNLTNVNKTLEKDMKILQDTNNSQSTHVNLLESERQAVAERTGQSLQAKLSCAQDIIKIYEKSFAEIAGLPGRKGRLIKRDSELQIKSREETLEKTLSKIKRESNDRKLNRDKLVKMLHERESQLALLLGEFEQTVSELEVSKEAQSKISQAKEHYEVMLKEVENILADRDEELRSLQKNLQLEIDTLKSEKKDITDNVADRMVHAAVDTAAGVSDLLNSNINELENIIEKEIEFEDDDNVKKVLSRAMQNLKNYSTARSEQIRNDPEWIMSLSSFHGFDLEIEKVMSNDDPQNCLPGFLVGGVSINQDHDHPDGTYDQNDNEISNQQESNTTNNHNNNTPMSPSGNKQTHFSKLKLETERNQIRQLLLESRKTIKDLREKLATEITLKNDAEKRNKGLTVQLKHTYNKSAQLSPSKDNKLFPTKGGREDKDDFHKLLHEKRVLSERLEASSEKLKSLFVEKNKLETHYKQREIQMARKMESKFKLLQEKISISGSSDNHLQMAADRRAANHTKVRDRMALKSAHTTSTTSPNYKKSTIRSNSPSRSRSPSPDKTSQLLGFTNSSGKFSDSGSDSSSNGGSPVHISGNVTFSVVDSPNGSPLQRFVSSDLSYPEKIPVDPQLDEMLSKLLTNATTRPLAEAVKSERFKISQWAEDQEKKAKVSATEQAKERERMLGLVTEARGRFEKKLAQSDADIKRLKDTIRRNADEIIMLKKTTPSKN